MLRITAGLAAASAVALAVSIGSCTPGPAPSGPPAGVPGAITSNPSPAATGPVTEPLTIYYVSGPKLVNTGDYLLYREIHQARLPDGSPSSAVAAAVRLALTEGSANDPDYQTTWPGMVRVQSVSVAGGVATVDLADVPPAPTYTKLQSSFRHAYIQSAIQQLIWTATSYPGVTGVRLLFDGQTKNTLWDPAFPVGGVLHRGSAADVLAPVWITYPQQGTTVAPPAKLSVTGFTQLGVIRVTITRDGKQVVPAWIVDLGAAASPPGTSPAQPGGSLPGAGASPAPPEIPGQYQASRPFTLPAGTYTVAVYIQYAIDKQGPELWDDHTFTVS